jgi:hypothetical protein
MQKVKKSTHPTGAMYCILSKYLYYFPKTPVNENYEEMW